MGTKWPAVEVFALRMFLYSVKQAVGGRPPLCPRSSPPSVGAEAPRTAEPTAPDRNVAVGSHGEYVPTLTAAAA